MRQTLNKSDCINDIPETTYFPNMLPYLIRTYFRENRLKITSCLDTIQIGELSSECPNNINEPTRGEVKNSKENINKLSNLLTQRDRIYYERGINFSIMICGQRGVGKTTIIEKLFDIDLSLNKEYSNFKEEIELIYNNASNSNSKSANKSNSNINSNLISKGITINLKINEISNFDNNKVNNSFDWISIINEINRHKIQYFEETQKVYRNNASSQDKKIHICLYVVEPNQVTSLDIITMKMIGQTTRMIPIINKIDIVSDTKELDRLKYELQRLFEIYEINFFQNDSGNVGLNPICIHKDDVSNLKKIIIDKNMVDLIDNDDININSFNGHCFKINESNDFWWEENLLLKQINLQKKYRELIESQNKKFQEWIKMLIQKQRRCNYIIEQSLTRINLVREECQTLEDRLVTLHDSNKHLSNKETTFTTNCNNSSKTLVVTNRVSDGSDNNNRNKYEFGYSGDYNANFNKQKKNTDKNENPSRNGNYLTENVRVMRY